MQKLGCLPLLDVKVRLAFANPFKMELIGFFIALGAGCPDSRTFLGIKHPKLQARQIGRFPHLAAQGIDLPGQMTFGQAADGRVARHLTDSIGINRQ